MIEETRSNRIGLLQPPERDGATGEDLVPEQEDKVEEGGEDY